RRVLAEPGVSALGGERADVDDAAPRLRTHERQHGVHGPPRRLHPGAPGHVELLLGNVLDRAARSEAVRVVHQDVDPALPADGLLDHRLHGAALPDVDHRRHALATVRADLLRRALGTVKLDLRDADLGTLAREEERDGATDALTRSRHDGDLAVEAAHFLPL